GGGGQRPPRRAQGQQLDPLPAHDPREGGLHLRGDGWGGRVGGRGGVGGQGAHWFSAFAVLEVVGVVWGRYSTASCVRLMYASSRLARRGDSACSSSPWSKATSPTCSAVVPLTSSIPASGEVTVAPSAARAAASSPARGERTRTAPPATESMTCWTGPAAM